MRDINFEQIMRSRKDSDEELIRKETIRLQKELELREVRTNWLSKNLNIFKDSLKAFREEHGELFGYGIGKSRFVKTKIRTPWDFPNDPDYCGLSWTYNDKIGDAIKIEDLEYKDRRGFQLTDQKPLSFCIKLDCIELDQALKEVNENAYFVLNREGDDLNVDYRRFDNMLECGIKSMEGLKDTLSKFSRVQSVDEDIRKTQREIDAIRTKLK